MLCERELNATASFMVPNNPLLTHGSTIITLSGKKKKKEGHDGPVSLHWLILGNSFKTYDPKEGLKLVAMSSNKKISKYFTK